MLRTLGVKESFWTEQRRLEEWIDRVSKEAVVRVALQWIDDLAEWNEPSILERRQTAASLLRAWLTGSASVAQVRPEAFETHRLARRSADPLTKTALRYLGHLLATVHVKTHLEAALRYRVKLPLPPFVLPDEIHPAGGRP